MQFMYSSIEKLVQNFSYADLKYLLEKSNPEQLELVKWEGMYPYDYVESLKDFMKLKYLIKASFMIFLKIKELI